MSPLGPDVSAVVADTMAISAMMHPGHPTGERHRTTIGERSVLVLFATVTELRYGAFKAGWGELRRRRLDRDLDALTVVQPNDELLTACALLRAECERSGLGLGQKIHEADRWIAATAMNLAIPLLSEDKIFDNVPGLTVVVE